MNKSLNKFLRLINQAQNDIVCDMNINVLSKYIILFLFAVLVVLSVLLSVEKASNNKLTKENARLTEMIKLRDAAITEIDKNIASLQEQVLEAESICNERLKARENLLTFLSVEPTYNVGKKQTPSEINLHNGSKKGSVAPPATELKKIDSSVAPLSQNDRSGQSQNNKVGIYEVISKNKSDYAVNSINSYISMFLTYAGDSKK